MLKNITLFGVRHPIVSIVFGVLLIASLASGIGKLVKDTRSDAFLAPDNPALVYKEKVKEIFGLSDPMVIAIISTSDRGIFTPESIQLTARLTEKINNLESINAERTVSLATENYIAGTSSGMDVVPFIDIFTEQGVTQLKNAVRDFPLYNGLLVSDDGQMTLIVAELYDDNTAGEAYQHVLSIVAEESLPQGTSIHVAGEGAVAGYLGQYIDEDASRLNPLAALIITIMIIFAFRRFLPGLLANFVIAGTVLGALGLMAHMGVAFFVITNSMPIILIGIAVADSVHIFSHYYAIRLAHPEITAKHAIEQATWEMARPVTLTSLTTIAGFIGLAVSAHMPPFKYFGIFTAAGVTLAWFFSLFVLPAIIRLCKPKPSKRWARLAEQRKVDALARGMAIFGRIATHSPRLTISFFAMVSVVSVFLAQHLHVNYNRIDTFHHDQPIYQADKAMNSHMDGTNTINIIVETPDNEGIFNPEVLAKIEALQLYAESLETVQGSNSIVDYLKQMHKSLNEGQENFYVLPDDQALIAQYFLLYSASGNPTDFEEEVDYDYRLANIHLSLNTNEYAQTKVAVEKLQDYLVQTFNTPGLVSANLSGRVYLNYHWLKDLGQSHAISVAIALLLVLLVSSVLFGSLTAGVLSTIPVMFSTLLVYAAMVIMDIDLGIGTSMFASVAIGLGIDFAIHTLDRMAFYVRQGIVETKSLLTMLYVSAGRALLINYLAIACGFGVLIFSQVVPLNEFGSIVVLAVTVSFVTAMTLLPALVIALRPKFIFAAAHADKVTPTLRPSTP